MLSEIVDVSSSFHQVCIMGAGYVGTTTAAVLALKHPAIYFRVVDCDEDRINDWNSAQPPIQEPQLSTILADVKKHKRPYLPRFKSFMPEHKPDADCTTVLATRKRHGAVEEYASNAIKRFPNLEFSVDVDKAVRDAEIIFITVNTPTKSNSGGWDLTHFNSVLRKIAEIATSDKIVVAKSTVPCGTAQCATKYLEQHGQEGVNFTVLSNPEFMRQGCAVSDFLNPARVIIGFDVATGLDSNAVLLLKGLYSTWITPDRILIVSTASAELAKIASNAMIAQRISNVNALSAMCEATGAKVSDVTRVCGMDPRIGPDVFQAGLGFGGSCLPKDLLGLGSLALDLNLDEVASYWKQILTINEYQGKRLFQRILAMFDNDLTAVKVAVLGFAYKKATGDGRESPVKPLIVALLNHGVRVSVHDPLVSSEAIRLEFDKHHEQEDCLNTTNLQVHTGITDTCRRGELVIVASDADEYQRIDWRTVSQSLCGRRIIYDMRGVVDRVQLAE